MESHTGKILRLQDTDKCYHIAKYMVWGGQENKGGLEIKMCFYNKMEIVRNIGIRQRGIKGSQ